MDEVRVYAPGKLLVVGEYAVLHGDRALVVAMDSGIECFSSPCPQGWWLAAPDLGVDAPLGTAGKLASGAGLLVAAVDRGAHAFVQPSPRHLTVQAHGRHGHRKVGLGGSAASVVAIMGALAATAGHDLENPLTRSRLFDLSLAVHREHQHGLGSGADVAATVFGGWLGYQLRDHTPHVAHVAPPPELTISAAWTGVETPTLAGLAAFDRLPNRRRHLDRMHTVLRDFWCAFEQHQRTDLGNAVCRYGELLDDLAQDLQLPTHVQVSKLVRASKAATTAVKGSGAVGGDCVIALCFSSAQSAALRSAWKQVGVSPLHLSPDLRGVRVVRKGRTAPTQPPIATRSGAPPHPESGHAQ
ncbi:mevalonate kinase family protein [Streptomyces sp. NBC_01264]|uniref:mevalonate kinase family protein n=1 Tax=Streptomyces sp. NBC_01264 TaxID=2903804 RepID=UPI00338F0839